MDPSDPNQHISEVCTRWSRVLHPGQELPRYYGPVYRYLLGVTRDPAAAQELANDFAVRFLEGKFKEATPEKGRLRDLIKKAVRNLAVDFWRKRQREKARPLTAEEDAHASRFLTNPETEEFDIACRDDLLAQAWQALKNAEQTSGKPVFTVLKFKVDHPAMRSADLAQQVGNLLHKELTPETVRQMLHRARNLFADLLLQALAGVLGSSDPAALEKELIDLKLLEYCKSALDRRKK